MSQQTVFLSLQVSGTDLRIYPIESEKRISFYDQSSQARGDAHCCKTLLSNNLSSLLLSEPAAISEAGPSGTLICRREPLSGRPVVGSIATRVKRESETGRIVGFVELRSSKLKSHGSSNELKARTG